ncbi:succinyl-diaminopimelate desuccinylase [Algiphilus sp.]|uniref:succinyl-diaminopimelate desuccinylase n=1 Tax=Algiphilus sp. TaxID=1872431 RepID=UPI003C5B54FB
MADDPTRALLERLIACRSVTPDDAGCCDILAAELAPLGFQATVFDAGGVRNRWFRIGDRAPLFVFAGHTDVVPPGPEERWTTPPFTPTERDGVLYGRGAADMKSGISAMVTAVRRYLADNPDPPGSIAFLITSDEEGAATHGTRHVMRELFALDVHPDFAIVGEASSVEQLGDRVMIGRRGSLNLRLRVDGRQGHVAYPHRVDNPIHRISRALAALADEEWDGGDADFPPTSFQVSNVNAGTGANNVVPGSAEALCNFRYNPLSSADSLRTRAEAIIARHCPHYEAEWQLSGEPFATARGVLSKAADAAIRDVTGLTPEFSTAGGTSDARFIAPAGAQVVEIGPINASIHQIDEHVRIADLDPLARIYEGVLRRVMAAPA